MVTQIWDAETVEARDKRTRSPGFFKPPITKKSSSKVIAPENCVERQVSARVFPNGEFGVGYVPSRKMSAEDCRYERDRRYAEENAEIQVKVVLDEAGNITYYGREKIPAYPPPKLGIGADLSQPSCRYGLKGITAHGRKMLRNAGHIMDAVAKQGKGYIPQMGTLTIPSLEPERMMLIAKHWADIQKRFFQECRRRYARFNKIFDYAACTEIQPGRWVDRGEVGLHVHFLFIAFRLNRKVWSLPDQWVRTVWRRVLVRYVGEEGVPDNLNYRREPVRDSSAAYIAKYASKGAEFITEVAARLGQEAIPSRWWSINTRLGHVIRRHTLLSSGAMADMLLCICSQDMTEYLRYKREVTMTTNVTEYGKAHNCPTEILLGYGGLLTNVGLRLFAPADRDESIRKHMHLTLDRCYIN